MKFIRLHIGALSWFHLFNHAHHLNYKFSYAFQYHMLYKHSVLSLASEFLFDSSHPLQNIFSVYQLISFASRCFRQPHAHIYEFCYCSILFLFFHFHLPRSPFSWELQSVVGPHLHQYGKMSTFFSGSPVLFEICGFVAFTAVCLYWV